MPQSHLEENFKVQMLFKDATRLTQTSMPEEFYGCSESIVAELNNSYSKPDHPPAVVDVQMRAMTGQAVNENLENSRCTVGVVVLPTIASTEAPAQQRRQ
jgi:FixJ family two-component response regulator